MTTDKKLKSGDKRLENLSRDGRPKGVPNKSTALAREAIARFVDLERNSIFNIERF
jgi:hypothetical protein